MEWWKVLLIVIIVLQALSLLLSFLRLILSVLTTSGMAKIVKSQEVLSSNMQSLSEQGTDFEERLEETRRIIVNFAKGIKIEKTW